MSEPGLSKLQAVIAAKKAALAKKEAEANQAKEFESLAPETQYEYSAEQKELDKVLDTVDIISAYRKWSNKSEVHFRPGQVEGIKISCPNPAHPDRHPSAWINTDLQVWHCASCNLGGDKYDIAAWRLGFSVPDYKTGSNFHKLREAMAIDMGYVIEKVSGSDSIIYIPEVIEVDSETEGTQAPERTEIETVREALKQAEPQANEENLEENLATVTQLHGDPPPIVFENIRIDWEELVGDDTFLRAYMEATCVDDAAEEYHFWNALLALGAAVGKDVTLYDGRPVYANLLVCILGGTGDRKSRSFSHLKHLLRTYLPSKYADPNDKGVYLPGALASGEALITSFSKPITDPTNPKLVVSYGAVRGLVEFNELSSLMSRTNRIGATLKDVIMDFADTNDTIATTSVTNGRKQADNAFCSIFTTTQPESMKDLVKKSDTTSGFLNRWIFATGIPKQRQAIGGFGVNLAYAGTKLQEIHRWPGLKGIEIQWSKEAAKKFTEHYYTKIEKIQAYNPILARLDLLEKKLILLFCINERLSEVSESAVDKAIALHDYLVSIFLASAKMAGGHESNEIEEEIMRQIKMLCSKSSTNTVTLRRVKQNIAHRNWDTEKVNRVWKMIKEQGDIEEVKLNDGKRGRPSIAYKYVGED